MSNAGILDTKRFIKCASCGQEQLSVDATKRGGICIGCSDQMCAFCGCTEDHGCVDTNATEQVNCSWIEQGVCDFCTWRIAEEQYNRVTGNAHLNKAFEPHRPQIEIAYALPKM